MSNPVRIVLYVQRQSDRDGFVAQVEREEPWWADTAGYGATPEAAAADALAALNMHAAIPSPEWATIETDA